MILIPKHKDALQISGALSLILTDTTNDKIKQEMYVPNLVVTTGKNWIASRFIGNTPTNTPMTHMGIGIGTTNAGTDAAALAMTMLADELSQTRSGTADTSYTRVTTTATNATNTNSVQYISTFNANNPNVTAGVILREAGIFTLVSTGPTAGTPVGIMLCRTVFPTVTKMPNDSLTITWTITIN